MAPRLANVASEPPLAIDPQDAAAEANHRIANNLTIIAEYVRSELSSFSQEKPPDLLSIRRSLQQLSLRIDAIGRLHRLLTNTPSTANVEICSYLREIADAARCSLARADRIHTLFFLETDVLVSAQQAVAIGAIASEALANSIKYAHPEHVPGVVSIRCERTGCNRVVIEIKDDGVGRPPSFLEKGAPYGGTGTGLMRSLADSLNAHLQIIDGQSGYIVRFEVPLPEQATQ